MHLPMAMQAQRCTLLNTANKLCKQWIQWKLVDTGYRLCWRRASP